MAESGYSLVMAGTGGVSRVMPALPAQAAAGPPSRPGCADLVAGRDWSGTELGPRDHWDPAVSATVELVLSSPMPMVYAHGDGFLLIYNDAYADLIGTLHPAALGQPAAEVFGDLWESRGFGGVVDEVYRSGRPRLEPETQLTVVRNSHNRP